MSTKYKGTYRIETTRLKNWDYGSRGFYFVTICTKNRQPYFGRIVRTQADDNIETQACNNVETQAGNNVETQNFASLRPVQMLTRIGDVAN